MYGLLSYEIGRKPAGVLEVMHRLRRKQAGSVVADLIIGLVVGVILLLRQLINGLSD
jgi:hypothetical protein